MSILKRSQNGLTLLEVILAISILSFGLIIIVSTFSSGMRAAGSAYKMMLAQSLAQSKMEELLVAPWASMEGEFGPDHPSFTWQVKRTPHDPGLQKIVLTIFWKERGKRREIRLETLVLERRDR
jgi:general secretion pathway protein I